MVKGCERCRFSEKKKSTPIESCHILSSLLISAVPYLLTVLQVAKLLVPDESAHSFTIHVVYIGHVVP